MACISICCVTKSAFDETSLNTTTPIVVESVVFSMTRGEALLAGMGLEFRPALQAKNIVSAIPSLRYRKVT